MVIFVRLSLKLSLSILSLIVSVNMGLLWLLI
jgi:hypothetical protein